jgi:hypothetical protein
LSWIINIAGVFTKAQGDYSLTKSILGPNGLFINIVVTPLGQKEAEPSVEETRRYFEGFAYRQNLSDESTGTIEVLAKTHFTAKYFRTNANGAQLIKKYSLYVERMEYLITVTLANILRDEERPGEAKVNENENVCDTIVRSLYLETK